MFDQLLCSIEYEEATSINTCQYPVILFIRQKTDNIIIPFCLCTIIFDRVIIPDDFSESIINSYQEKVAEIIFLDPCSYSTACKRFVLKIYQERN